VCHSPLRQLGPVPLLLLAPRLHFPPSVVVSSLARLLLLLAGALLLFELFGRLQLSSWRAPLARGGGVAWLGVALIPPIVGSLQDELEQLRGEIVP